MRGYTILRARDRAANVWKNGGGITEEIAVFPKGAGFDDFLWRASIARIESDGPFSELPRVNRLFCALEGRLSITIDGDRQDINPADPPIAFDGTAAVSARPLDGVALDFNIMTRKGCEGSLSKVTGKFSISGDYVLLLALQTTELTLQQFPLILGTYDALLIEKPTSIAIESAQPLLVASIINR